MGSVEGCPGHFAYRVLPSLFHDRNLCGLLPSKGSMFASENKPGLGMKPFLRARLECI